MTQTKHPDSAYLGIELGSTRIKACLVDGSLTPVAGGGHQWENRYENGYFTYSLEDIHGGLRACYASFKADYTAKFGAPPTRLDAMGISGMMHGYLAFDAEGTLLAPFRTWRNTSTEAAATALTRLFGFNIPLRWSIAHLYQAMLNGEEHVGRIAHITTLSGYVHYLLTGRWELGIGEASGMFPVDRAGYAAAMLDAFDDLVVKHGYPWRIRDILPAVRRAGETGAYLTESGARFLDPNGDLMPGIPLCPPEGDADTGMVSTNSVGVGTGNVSGGTSVFGMVVLDRALEGVYPEIDVAATPGGYPVAMVHANNGCSELDLWVGMMAEAVELTTGRAPDMSEMYSRLYNHAMTAPADGGGMVCYNYLAAEPVADVDGGCPMILRRRDSHPHLADFFRAQLYAAVAVIRMGMDILTEREGVTVTHLNAHGGLFKVPDVAARCLADALHTPVSVSAAAGEGGAWGMALLAAYMKEHQGMALEDWLDACVFGRVDKITSTPDPVRSQGFEAFYAAYQSSLPAQRALT